MTLISLFHLIHVESHYDSIISKKLEWTENILSEYSAQRKTFWNHHKCHRILENWCLSVFVFRRISRCHRMISYKLNTIPNSCLWGIEKTAVYHLLLSTLQLYSEFLYCYPLVPDFAQSIMHLTHFQRILQLKHLCKSKICRSEPYS